MNEVSTQVAFDEGSGRLVEGVAGGPLDPPTPSWRQHASSSAARAAPGPYHLQQQWQQQHPAAVWAGPAEGGAHQMLAPHRQAHHQQQQQLAALGPGQGQDAHAYMHAQLALLGGGVWPGGMPAGPATGLPMPSVASLSQLHGSGWGTLSVAFQSLRAASMLEQLERTVGRASAAAAEAAAAEAHTPPPPPRPAYHPPPP
jgi:hypothetical protein